MLLITTEEQIRFIETIFGPAKGWHKEKKGNASHGLAQTPLALNPGFSSIKCLRVYLTTKVSTT